MSLLTKEQILSADDLKRQVVQVPEWRGEVLVATLTGEGRDAIEAECFVDGNVNRDHFRAKICAACIVDESGSRIFSQDDIHALGKKSSRALERVFVVACKLNGFTKEDVAELAKN